MLHKFANVSKGSSRCTAQETLTTGTLFREKGSSGLFFFTIFYYHLSPSFHNRHRKELPICVGTGENSSSILTKEVVTET